MKSSIKGLFVILAIVMSFVLVQGVYALDPDDIETFTGTVTSVDEKARSISLDVGNEDGDCVIDGLETSDVTTISHMGPSWYWQIPYPTECDILKIEAFYCNSLPGWVGISVCYLDSSDLSDDCINPIKLRDSLTLKPLWNPNAKTTDLSDTAAEATGDCCPDCPDGGDCEPIFNNYTYSTHRPHGK